LGKDPKNKDKPLFLSALSISYVLGMLLAGAKGQTAQQIINVLSQGKFSIPKIVYKL
jgi:serine protease inhibitor